MDDKPIIDGRKAEDVFKDAKELASSYTSEWDEESADSGTALLEAFSNITEDVLDRLDRVPEKHRVSFFDTLGFQREPPQPAQVPLTFRVTTGVDGNVTVPESTRVVAEPSESSAEQTFEIEPGSAFEATPATIEQVYSVDPRIDAVFNHRDGIENQNNTELFYGTNRQEHVLFIGHCELLNLNPGATIQARIETNVSPTTLTNTRDLVWEFYGELPGAEPEEEWHRCEARFDDNDYQPARTGEAVTIQLDLPGAPIETEVSGTKSRWIRCRIPTDDREIGSLRDLFEIEIYSMELLAGGATMPPDQLVYNDVALGIDSNRDSSDDVYPFGRVPRQYDSFYIASEEAFTKKGAMVDVTFDPPSDQATVTFENQQSENGKKVQVKSATLPRGGFVAIYATETLLSDPDSRLSPIGVSAYLEPGTHRDVEISLFEGVPGAEFNTGRKLEDDQTLVAMAHRDTNRNRVFDFLTSDQPADIPYIHPRRYRGVAEIEHRVLDTAEVVVEETDDKPTWPITFNNQTSDGTAVVVDSVTVPADLEEGFVAVYKEAAFGKKEETEIGISDPLQPDSYRNIEIPLDESEFPVDESKIPFDDQPLLAVLHRTRDEPYRREGEYPVVDSAWIVVADDRHPALSWEYWNGTAWTRIPDLEDGTQRLHIPGTVTLRIPEDLASTTVSGQESYWIRTRLVDGEFVQVSYESREEGMEPKQIIEGRSPRFAGIQVRYEQTLPPKHLVTYNNLNYQPRATRFRPFVGHSDTNQALYLGFDRALRNGPLTLFFTFEDKEYPTGFYPRVRWECREDPESDEWVRLQVQDGTESLTKQGIVRFSLSGETAATELFGHDLHWIRAIVTGQEEFSRTETSENDELADALLSKGIRIGSRREAMSGVSAPSTEARLSADRPPTTPPVLRGISPNTGWAYNVRMIDKELLGSSDGSPNQEFAFDVPPVIDDTVWVDEFRTISEDERQELLDVRPGEVERVTDSDGELREFWVQWYRVEDFLDSNRDNRHYTLDSSPGELVFGNGVRGKIPPRGRDNIRASYKTGGGVQGNVAAGTVSGLISSISFIDSVTNPVPGDGGADAEPIKGVFTRAPKQLRHRGRAVAVADFERIALDASRKLARVRCIPEMDRSGARHIGWVTLLIVPNVQRPNPIPSPELKERVFEAVRERAPATLVGPEDPHLVVRGPRYVEISVETRLVAESVGSISSLEERVEAEITAFLHPLSGGSSGDGWAFGERPYLSDLYALLEGIEKVDHVRDLSVTFRGSDRTTSVTEGGPTPTLAQDEVIYSGMHEVRVVGTKTGDNTGEP